MHDFALAFIGGMMIGVSAVMLFILNGRVMGISGIASRLIPPITSDWSWRVLFLFGLLSAAPLALIYSGKAPTVDITANPLLLIGGGLLVGFGTVLGNGCTSGHGVCGLSRFSIRSAIATGIFMLSAIITVLVVKLFTGAV